MNTDKKMPVICLLKIRVHPWLIFDSNFLWKLSLPSGVIR
jgi:hypothetical protein